MRQSRGAQIECCVPQKCCKSRNDDGVGFQVSGVRYHEDIEDRAQKTDDRRRRAGSFGFLSFDFCHLLSDTWHPTPLSQKKKIDRITPCFVNYLRGTTWGFLTLSCRQNTFYFSDKLWKIEGFINNVRKTQSGHFIEFGMIRIARWNDDLHVG